MCSTYAQQNTLMIIQTRIQRDNKTTLWSENIQVDKLRGGQAAPVQNIIFTYKDASGKEFCASSGSEEFEPSQWGFNQRVNNTKSITT